MITTTDIQNILYKDCKERLGIQPFQDGNIPKGEITTERVIIHSKQQTPSKYWEKGFVEVNICVPDIKGKADLMRLNELERLGKSVLDDVYGKYDGSDYIYSISSYGKEEDLSLKCHYINFKLLFQILNVKK